LDDASARKISDTSPGAICEGSFATGASAQPPSTPPIDAYKQKLRDCFLLGADVNGRPLTEEILDTFTEQMTKFAQGTQEGPPSQTLSSMVASYIKPPTLTTFQLDDAEPLPLFAQDGELHEDNFLILSGAVRAATCKPPIGWPIFKHHDHDPKDAEQIRYYERIFLKANGPLFNVPLMICCFCLCDTSQGTQYSFSRTTADGRKTPRGSISASHSCSNSPPGLRYFICLASPPPMAAHQTTEQLFQRFAADRKDHQAAAAQDYSAMPTAAAALAASVMRPAPIGKETLDMDTQQFVSLLQTDAAPAAPVAKQDKTIAIPKQKRKKKKAANQQPVTATQQTPNAEGQRQPKSRKTNKKSPAPAQPMQPAPKRLSRSSSNSNI